MAKNPEEGRGSPQGFVKFGLMRYHLPPEEEEGLRYSQWPRRCGDKRGQCPYSMLLDVRIIFPFYTNPSQCRCPHTASAATGYV